ncbi:SnoaL-like protein [Novosphingobium kunmingense]|uniref:SnoaL-like protein n=1 Tax=Novosphingobium kunmingense TaxID=1211806 RepID=A0A2N0H3D8_9SPHN|nr:nuclear transport factor 2 family protein [Novosphingobium kunmingense]PKB13410.1 SnoaL-like protein [Novosphingobium kunmingense]
MPLVTGGPEALVVGYACALDQRDWAAFRSLFGERVRLDYGAIGSVVGPIAADLWTQRCRALEGFDATLHRITNMRVTRAGDTAVVDSYVDALHFITIGRVELVGQLAGTYRHELVRAAKDRWQIAACTIRAAGFPGGRVAFDRAFAAARARNSGVTA